MFTFLGCQTTSGGVYTYISNVLAITVLSTVHSIIFLCTDKDHEVHAAFKRVTVIGLCSNHDLSNRGTEQCQDYIREIDSNS